MARDGEAMTLRKSFFQIVRHALVERNRAATLGADEVVVPS
jgi:hypothetical protein